MDILLAIVSVIILFFGLIKLIHTDCMVAFYHIGKKYPATKIKLKTKVYRFSAKIANGEKLIYSGGILSMTKDGLYIRHELIFRPFLHTSLVPWNCIDADISGAKLFSVVLRLDDRYDIMFMCRHRAIVEICKWYKLNFKK